MHWRRHLVYFSTSRDRVHRIDLNTTRQHREAVVDAARWSDRTPATAETADVVYQAGSQAGGAGLRLSVDWLYERLYVADQNTVSTSHLPVSIATTLPKVSVFTCYTVAALHFARVHVSFAKSLVLMSYFLFTLLVVLS